jgi:hypothetical protein
MHARNRERYKALCEIAEVENDPKKLRKLSEQIDRILDIEVRRLKNRQKSAPGSCCRRKFESSDLPIGSR